MSLRQALAGHEPIIAVNPGGPSIAVVDAIARHGARALFIDCERSPVGVGEVPGMVRAARAAGLFSLLRSESRDPAVLLRYLDAGVDGLVLPQVETSAQCAMLDRVATDHALGPATAALVVQIETVAGVEAVEAIGTAPGIDAVLLGPNDLALSMGLPGQPGHPEVQAQVRAVAARLSALGRSWGLPVAPGTVAGWVGQGARLLYVPLDQLIGTGLGALKAAMP